VVLSTFCCVLVELSETDKFECVLNLHRSARTITNNIHHCDSALLQHVSKAFCFEQMMYWFRSEHGT
jgi:hypothetical protein